MARLGRSLPIQPRLIAPQPPPAAAIRAGGRVKVAGSKNATGSAVIRVSGVIAPAPGGHTGSGSARVRGGAVISPSAQPPLLRSTWIASYTAPPQPAGVPLPGPASIQIAVANTAGNWLFAAVGWRQAPGYPPVTFSVGDGANRWEPMGVPTGGVPSSTSPAAGSIRVAVWRTPAARAVSQVCAAPTGFCLSAAAVVLEVSGLAPWVAGAGAASVFQPGTSTLPALAPPGSQVPVFWVTACVRSLSSPTGVYPASSGLSIPFSAVPGEAAPGQAAPGQPLVPLPTSSGGAWQPGPMAATGSGLDHASDIVLLTAFQQVQGNVSAAWSQSAPSDMAAVLAGVQAAAPAPVQPNPAWAPGVLEIAPGAGPGTPADEITWVQVDGFSGVPVRQQDLAFTQGQQYTVGQLQSGSGAVTIDNRDLAVTPPGVGALTGIDSGIPWRYRATWPGGGNYPVNPTPHYTLAGFTVDLPSTWKTDTRRGIVKTGLTDAWAYCQPQISSALAQEMLADSPGWLWPCGDAAGAAYASNLAHGSTSALVQVTSKYGGAGATGAFGASAILSAAQAAVAPGSSSGLPGTGGTVWAQAGLPAAPTSGGYALYCQDPAFPPLTNADGVSVECWSALADPVLWQNATLWALKGTKGTMMRVHADTTGALWLSVWDLHGNKTLTSLGPAPMTGAGMFQTAVAWAPAGWVAYVSGVPVASGGPLSNPPRPWSWLTAGGEADRQATQNFFDGQTTFLAVFPATLPPARVATHWQAGASAFAGEPDHSRIERLLGYAGYTGRRAIRRQATPDLTSSLASLGTSTSSSSVGGAPTPAGITTVQAGQMMTGLVASLTPAQLYVAPPGDIVWRPKGLSFGQAAAWTLSDTSGIPYQVDAEFGWDPQFVLNNIQITQADRQDVVTPQAFVPLAPGYQPPNATQPKYGQQTYQISGYLFNDLTTPLQSPDPSNLLDLANWISITLAAPHSRAGKITVDAASYPAAWPLVLGASPGDMALVGRSPITAPSSISLLARIMRVERHIAWQAGKPAATAVLTLDYCPEAVPIVLDDPAAGLLDGDHVLAW